VDLFAFGLFWVFSLFLASSLFILGLRTGHRPQGMAAEKPFVIEYYYKQNGATRTSSSRSFARIIIPC